MTFKTHNIEVNIMKKNIKVLSSMSVALLLTTTGINVINSVEPTASVQTVKASETSTIKLPSGYTASAILKANNNQLSATQKKALIASSMAGMKNNNFVGNPSDKNVMVDVTNLTWGQKVEINRFALNLINSARAQLGKKPWTLNGSAIYFADYVAREYHDNNRSVWDSDHYTAGIERAAAKMGLNSTAGQVYEDEAGLPITSQFNGTKRSMYVLKAQIYYNIQQMLFGGFYGTNSDMNNASRYTEWEHAGDLLGLRSLKGYDATTKYFGMSFSNLKNNPGHISVHMMGVSSNYIKNKKTFNPNWNIK